MNDKTNRLCRTISTYLFFLIIDLILICSNTTAQRISLSPSPINQQLLQNSITGIDKDNAGNIWIATHFGLFKYDGQNLTPYFAGVNNKIKTNRLAYIINNDNVKNALITIDENNEYIIQHGDIKMITPSPSQFCITTPSQLYYINRNNLPDTLKKIKRIGVTNILVNATDTIFEYGNKIYNNSSKQFVEIPHISGKGIGNIYRYKNVNYILLENGIYKIQDKNYALSLVFKLNGVKSFVKGSNNQLIFQNNQILIKYDLEKDKIQWKIDLTLFKIKEVSSVYEDELKIYIGTRTQGIFEGRKTYFPLIKLQKEGNKDNYIYSYYFNEHTKKYYIPTNEGLIQYRLDNQKIEQIHSKSLLKSQLTVDNDSIWCLEKNGKIIGIDLKTNKQFGSYDLQLNNINFIDKYKNNLIIAANNIIYKYNLNTNKNDTLLSFPKDFIVKNTIITDEQIITGTNNGVIIKNLKTNKQRHLLIGNSIRSILAYTDDIYIFGSYGDGAYIYFNGKLIKLKNDPFSFSNAVVALNKDDLHNLWIIGNKVLIKWEFKEIQNIINKGLSNYTPHYWTIYELSNEVKEFNGSSFPKRINLNEIAIPSSDGLLQINNAVLEKRSENPNIQLQFIQSDSIIFNSIENIHLPANNQNTIFQLSFPYFNNNNNFNVVYHIKGLNNEWKQLNHDRKIELTNLPSGSYTLQIEFTDDHTLMDIVHFSVKQYWYDTFYFYGFIVVFAIIIIIIALKIKSITFERRKKELEYIIDDKTKQLQQNIKTLSDSEKEITKLYKNNYKLYSILMHDLKSPLLFLSNFTLDQYRIMLDKATIDKESLNTIAATSADMYKFISEFLLWLQKQNKNIEPQITQVNINSLIKEVIDIFNSIALLNNNKIIYFPKGILPDIKTDEEMLKTIIRNIIDNANKYTKDGIIKVTASSTENNSIRIEIEDSGKGMPDYALKILNETQEVDMDKLSINANHKMGLLILIEFIKLLKAQYKINTNATEGTKFCLDIPISYYPQEI